MAQAKKGDTVKVHYTGKLDDGTVFDSSQGREPLEFRLGTGSVIPGFEEAVEGMQEGEIKTAHIPADQAYGEYHDEMLLSVPREQFPPDIEPQVGQELQLRQQDGQTLVVQVTDVSDGEVTLDANHPLAGENLTFDIQLVQVQA